MQKFKSKDYLAYKSKQKAKEKRRTKEQKLQYKTAAYKLILLHLFKTVLVLIQEYIKSKEKEKKTLENDVIS